jgi:glioma pathogenesis-related protein 2
MDTICAYVQRTWHTCTDMEVYMHQHRATLIGVILSLIACTHIDASATGRLDLEAFRAAALKQHNIYRAKHGVPPLVLSTQLNDVAQHYAEQLARTNQLVHSGNKYYGENLYAFGSSDPGLPRAEAVVDRWYSEIQNYDFNKPGFHTGTGHFTQLVWKSSKELGMGIAQAADGTWYVVGNYNPPGNISGQFPTNVLKPKN